jgi:hypothetical protein
MTDYEYIMARCRKYHFTGWDENELRECQSILPNLTREELVSVYRSRLLDERHPLKQMAFKVLFADKVGKREERIKALDTDALIEEFKDKKSGNVALIRKEMRERYKANKGLDHSKIASAFNASTKSDQQWVKSQVRKERYGDSNKSQWQKPAWKRY